MKQTIIKNGKVFCVTSAPYPVEVVNGMKRLGTR